MDIDLRPARPEDTEEMAGWFADLASLAEWGGADIRYPLTSEQMAGWIRAGADATPRLCFTAVDRTDRPIGHVQLLRDPPRRWARLGRFAIAPALRGRGFGRALFDAAVRKAFAEFAVEHLVLFVLPTNERARRLYLRAGFRDEGTTEPARLADGRPYAANIVMGLRRPEWIRMTGAESGAAKVA